MPDEPRPQRRRQRGGRRRGPPRPQQARPQQAPARPDAGAPRGDRPQRDDRRLAPRDRSGFVRDRRSRRGGRGRAPRSADDVRSGTSCLILVDAREGEPDRSGAPAVFEGFFDFETGEPRRAGGGIPRLRVEDERLWGFECWWRVDTERTGLTDADREDVESSKKLLRGLLRDARRNPRLVR
ncbi:MAG: hypothetical protein E6J52_09985 [Chloroflexi bacterium]|nr:MAG: hypothetical protein E6J52_09985 [Chloroflexota bacterium]